MSNGTTDNTAVRALIASAQSKGVDADDALFEPARKPLLPPPFQARGARSTMPPPLPRHRVPSSTRTDLQAAPPRAPAPVPMVAPATVSPLPVPSAPVPPPVIAAAPIAARQPSEHEVPTRPFDQIEPDELTEEPPAAASAPAVAPVAVGARWAAPMVDHTPSVEAAFWAAGEAASATTSVDVDFDVDDVVPAAPARLRATRRYAPRAAEVTQLARMPRRSDRRRAWMWIAGSFVVGVTATILIVRAGGGPAVAPPVAASQPAAGTGSRGSAPAVAPLAAVAPLVQPLAAPAVAPLPAPAAADVAAPVVAAPVVEEPVVGEPAAAALSDGTAVADEPAAAGGADEPVADEPVADEPVADDAQPAPTVAAVAPARSTTTRSTRARPAAKPAPVQPRVAAKPTAPATPARPAPRVAAATAAGGLLLVGSKPPCEIVIDGKATGLTTPQRAIKVVPGDHRITLINRQYRINESVTVVVKAGASVKVVKDLTAKMKR